jgi:hypothetical protein
MTELKKEDITEDYIKRHFRITRKTSTRSKNIPFKGYCRSPDLKLVPGKDEYCYYSAYFPSLEYFGYQGLPEWFKFIEESVDYSVFITVMAFQKEFAGYVENSLKVQMNLESLYDYRDEDSSPDIKISIEYKVKETEEQAIKRMIKTEKTKISRKENAEKKEADERKLLAELQEKYRD